MSVPVHLIKQYSPCVIPSVSSVCSSRAHSRSLSTSDCAICQWMCLSLTCRTSRFYSQCLRSGLVSSIPPKSPRLLTPLEYCGVLSSATNQNTVNFLITPHSVVLAFVIHQPMPRQHESSPLTVCSCPTHQVVPLHSTAATASSRVVAILPNQASSYRLRGPAVSVSIVQRKKPTRPSSG